MKYYLAAFLLLASVQYHFAQNNEMWKGYFSYNEIKDVSQSETRFFAASENALFSQNAIAGDIKTFNTIDGLPSQQIASIHHSPAFNKTLVGYNNGLMVVINESDNSILTVVDIINKQLPPNIKKINHFNEYEGIVYIACDFGIVQYNLTTLQFGDTYFIGPTNPEIVVNQTAVLNGYIYAATQNEGIRRAALANPNLIDATQWSSVATGSFSSVETFQGQLYAAAASGQITRSPSGTSFSPFGPILSSPPADMRATATHLIITSTSRVYVYNDMLLLTGQISSDAIPDIDPVFSCATVMGETVYIGTTEHGVITTTLANPNTFDFISPDGPSRNNIFSINTSSANLWAVYGRYTAQFDPSPLRYYGLSKFNAEDGWKNIPVSEADNAPHLVRVTVNPANENQIYVSSYYSGLLLFENDIFVTRYTEANTTNGPESIFETDPPDQNIRIEQSAYDQSGNLWFTNAVVKKAIKVLKAGGSWESYSVEPIVSDYFDVRFSRLSIDKNGTKWIASTKDGVIGFNEKFSNPYKKITTGEEGNLPTESVQVAAIDKRNQLWIGTREGLRVLSSVDRFTEDDTQLVANPIIIEEEGLGQELMANQFITDIVVDGANNKWIGTLDAGMFMFSPDGQKTLHHFTSSNSPLPSNGINDIDINSATGEVFFATENGMVSFMGSAIDPSDDLRNVVVYPNPVRPGYAGTVKITGLVDRANVKITDIEGSLVFETTAQSGTIEWDTSAFGRYKVASGVYMIFISAEDGLETKVKKVMIIR